MSSEEQVVVKKNKLSKMCLDSENEEEQEEERRRRRQQKHRRKKQRRERERQRQERQRRQRELEEEPSQQQQQESDYNILLAEDSNSHISFTKARQNIKRKYHSFKDQYTIEAKPVQKKVKRQQKTERRQKSPKRQEARVSKPNQSKLQQKQQLAYQLGKRWWYVLPEWPPKDYNYQMALKKQGYRIVNQQLFKKEPEVVDGLVKAFELDGYRGVFKSKQKLIDVRPKENCPNIQNFKKKESAQLTKLIRQAIQNQIAVLTKVQYKQNGEEDLLAQLKKQLMKYTN